MLELTEKLIRLLTALIIGSILFVLGIIVIIFLALTLVHILCALTGSAIVAYAIVSALFILLGVILYYKKSKWIVAPLTNFLTNILLKDNEK